MGKFLPTNTLVGCGKFITTQSIKFFTLSLILSISSCQKLEEKLENELTTSRDNEVHHQSGQESCDGPDARYIIDILNQKKQFDRYTIKFTEASRLEDSEKWNRILGSYLDSWNQNSLSLVWRQVAGVDSFEVAEYSYQNGVAKANILGKLALGEEGVFFLYKLHANQVTEAGHLLDQPGYIVATLADPAPHDVSFQLE